MIETIRNKIADKFYAAKAAVGRALRSTGNAGVLAYYLAVSIALIILAAPLVVVGFVAAFLIAAVLAGVALFRESFGKFADRTNTILRRR